MHASACTYCTTTQCTLHCADEVLKVSYLLRDDRLWAPAPVSALLRLWLGL